MALITCPECGREVSDLAAVCPNCGYNVAALKERNIVKIKISVCTNADMNGAVIQILDPISSEHVYATVHPGEIAKFEIESDTKIGFKVGITKIKAITVVSPGKKYQVFWGGNSTFLGLAQIERCTEVEEFSDVASGVQKPQPQWFIGW